MNSTAVHTLDFGTELFVDDALIASKRGITRILHPATKHVTPVMAADPDKPWEHVGSKDSTRILVYGTTMYNSAVGKYRPRVGIALKFNLPGDSIGPEIER